MKNKTIIDESNTIIANAVRLPDGDVLHFPSPPRGGEVILTMMNGKPVWKQSNDDKIRGLVSAIDSMTGGMAAAIDELTKRVDRLEFAMKDGMSRVDKRVNDVEESLDIETTRGTISRLKSDVSVIMEAIDGLVPDNYPEGGASMTSKLAKNVITNSNPVFSDGRVYVKGNLSDVIGALCRLVANNNTGGK